MLETHKYNGHAIDARRWACYYLQTYHQQVRGKKPFFLMVPACLVCKVLFAFFFALISEGGII